MSRQKKVKMSMHQSSSSPLVWFHLYDAATGLPYKGTSCDFVSPPPRSVIAQFRDAVYAKNPNKLSSLDAADLLVYKNKEAFDKRNTAVNEEKVMLNCNLLIADGAARRRFSFG
jgi:hypothetical protein